MHQRTRREFDERPFALLHADRMLAHIELMLRRACGDAPADSPEAFAEQLAVSALVQDEVAAAHEAGVLLPDAHLAEVYGLAAEERELLWLAAAPYMDAELRDLIARYNDDVTRDYVDPALCFRLLASDRRERIAAQALLSPGAHLLDTGLVRLVRRDGEGPDWMRHEVVPAGHVVSFLTGVRALGSVAAPFARWVRPAVTVEELALPAQVTGTLLPLLVHHRQRQSPAGPWYGDGALDFPRGLACLLQGAPGSGRTLAAKALAGSLGCPLIVVDGARLALAPLDVASECLTTVCREAALYGEMVVVRGAGAAVLPGKPLAGFLGQVISRHAATVLLCVEDDAPIDPEVDAVVVLRVPFSAAAARAGASFSWQVNLPGECIVSEAVNLKTLSSRFVLAPGQIRRAVQAAHLMAPDGADGVVLEPAVLDAAARLQVPSLMGSLAEVTDPDVRLSELVLPAEVRSAVDEIVSAVGSRHVVLQEWGLGRQLKRGIGICCLFDGDPGTGKTLCAEGIATHLGLRLVRVNIGGIVDKYIGETEKNLARVFERARPDTNLLLFDEADSLFSKRTEVSHSVDRYSNMDINALLQLIERYEGLTVLTTNLKRSIDPAFERRFTFKVSFTRPEAPERERIWRHLCPPSTPTQAPLDYARLGRIDLTGGEIKNALMRAAYAATRAGEALAMRHLTESARREAAAAGRLVRDE